MKLLKIGNASTTHSATSTPIGRRVTSAANRRQRGSEARSADLNRAKGRQNSRGPIISASGGINVIAASSETSSENASAGPSISAGANRDASSASNPRIVVSALQTIPGIVAVYAAIAATRLSSPKSARRSG